MTWFWLSLITMLCWSGSDLFSKIGCQDAKDKFGHLKMVMAIGLVMGLHAGYEILFGGVIISLHVLITYLPVSVLYILSMTIGYLGLRYIELSISSPICNSSGAIVAILYMCINGISSISSWQMGALGMVCLGVIALGITEMTEDEELRAARQETANRRYTKSVIALVLPGLYCLLDALGTFADSLVLERLDEDSANVAYELTFLLVGLICAFYVLVVKKQHLLPRKETPKYAGAVFETAGQLAYIYALSDQSHVMFSAPIISSYCAVSVLWGRLFLKEKLSWKHYVSILLTIMGIAVLGLFDELG